MTARPVIPTSGRGLRTTERIGLALEIAATYARARWWLMHCDFEESVLTARRVRRRHRPPASLEESMQAAIRLGTIVERCLETLPFDGRCLLRSLVLTRILARRGIESTFVLGVRARPVFVAHAWLERGGVPLLASEPDFERLHEL